MPRRARRSSFDVRYGRGCAVLSLAAFAAAGASACTYDFGRYSPSGDAGEADAATGSDATASDGSDSAPPAAEAGMDAIDTVEAGADVIEPPEASGSDASEASVVDYTVGGTIERPRRSRSEARERR